MYNRHMIEIRDSQSQAEWDDFVLSHGGHPLQLWQWGEVKAAHGWKAYRLLVVDGETVVGGAQILVRRLPGPLRALAYVPRGPVCDEPHRGEVLDILAGYAKKQLGAVVLAVEPDWTSGAFPQGWKRSPHTILLPRTIVLDLTKDEAALQQDMSKKTRQYIRKSGKEAIDIVQVKDEALLQECLAIYRQTAERAGFSLHDDGYYRDIFTMLGDHSPVFAAMYEGKPVSFLWLAISQDVAFELYGGMNDEGQRLRANYALKWHVIQTMKRWGIARYDFNGLLNDGVSTFKQGFAAEETMLVGTYDKPLSPLYAVWNKGLPTAKRVVRQLKSLRK